MEIIVKKGEEVYKIIGISEKKIRNLELLGYSRTKYSGCWCETTPEEIREITRAIERSNDIILIIGITMIILGMVLVVIRRLCKN
jgi:hypothetical protein